jgi:hypothetical protein
VSGPESLPARSDHLLKQLGTPISLSASELSTSRGSWKPSIPPLH